MKKNIWLLGQANATPPTVRYSSNLRRPIASNLQRRFLMNALCGPMNFGHSRQMIKTAGCYLHLYRRNCQLFRRRYFPSQNIHAQHERYTPFMSTSHYCVNVHMWTVGLGVELRQPVDQDSDPWYLFLQIRVSQYVRKNDKDKPVRCIMRNNFQSVGGYRNV